MSDIPELDRIIEEHDIFRSNMRWNQRDLLWVAMFRFQVTALLSLCLCVVLGVAGLAGVPFIWKWACQTFENPKPRAPFQRYRAM